MSKNSKNFDNVFFSYYFTFLFCQRTQYSGCCRPVSLFAIIGKRRPVNHFEIARIPRGHRPEQTDSLKRRMAVM
ncbi:unnamed protein product, partial [Ixodes pacificus]